MSLAERVARAMCWASMCGRSCDAPCDCRDWREYGDEAEAAIREVLAALREYAGISHEAVDVLNAFEAEHLPKDQ